MGDAIILGFTTICKKIWMQRLYRSGAKKRDLENVERISLAFLSRGTYILRYVTLRKESLVDEKKFYHVAFAAHTVQNRILRSNLIANLYDN